MGITATRLTSQLRTWLLITGLTALMISIGALLGGGFLWLFVLAAVGFNVVGYFQSDRIALRAARAQPLAQDDVPEVHAALAELSRRAGIPTPRLYVIPGLAPNAFATGRNPGHAAVALTDGLITHMATADVRAVMAHEIGHIANRDILVSSVAATISGAVGAAVNVLSLSFLFGGEDSGRTRSGRSAPSPRSSSPRWPARCSAWGSRASASTWPTRPPRDCSAPGRRWRTLWRASRRPLPRRWRCPRPPRRCTSSTRSQPPAWPGCSPPTLRSASASGACAPTARVP